MPINLVQGTVMLYFFLHNCLQSVCVRVSAMMYLQWAKASDNYLFPGTMMTVWLWEAGVTGSSLPSWELEDTVTH